MDRVCVVYLSTYFYVFSDFFCSGQHSDPTGILLGFYLRISLFSFGAMVNDTAFNILISVVCC